jgi:SAM-dependent methyltransferase
MRPEELHNIYRSEAEFWWYRGMRAIADALLDPVVTSKGLSILDAGCGTGFNAVTLQQRYGARVFGVDVAPLAVQYCRKNHFERSAVASIKELPFPSDAFDVVASFDVVCHLGPQQDSVALREFVRVLKPGGWLFVRVPAMRVLRSRHSEFTQENHRYHAKEMIDKVSAAGAAVSTWTYANALLSPIAFMKFRVWENIRKAPPSSGVQNLPPAWLNNLLTGVLRIEAEFVERRFRFVFGQSLCVVARKPAR